MRIYITGFLILFCSVGFSQSDSFQISGTLVAKSSEEPLESATVFIERPADSSLITYTISRRDGSFELTGQARADKAKLFVSYIGYDPYSVEVSLAAGPQDLGTIALTENENVLDEVVLRSRAPITIKKDTLEFNVKSFDTKKDATVEDLLKVLPGVAVDAEGKITVNGKPVNKILVNGKPFFGDDPTIATRNLTKEIIDKVQVTDTKSDAEAFAGEEGDTENKTINLTIDEEKNKGVFGRLSAGAGTDERYEYAGLFNRFDNDQQISVLAGGNNINSPGFSFGEISKMFGGARSMSISSTGSFTVDGRSFGIGEGIVTSNNVGANYADSYSEKLDISADYFYAGSDSENTEVVSRENLLPDFRFFTNSRSETNARSDGHTANAKLDVKADSTLLISLRPSFSYTAADRLFERSETTLDEDGVLTNQSDVTTFTENSSRSFNTNVDATKKMGSRGASLRTSVNVQFQTSEGTDFLSSETEIFGAAPETIVRDQVTDSEGELGRFSANLTYRYPIIARKLFLNLQYRYLDIVEDSRESTFSFDGTTQSYSIFNPLLSTDFTFKDRKSTPSVGIGYFGEKFSANLDGGYALRTLESEDRLRPEISISEDFEAFELNSYINYQFSGSNTLYANYSIRNEAPRLSQLQPFQDVSDPLNIVTGNPDLDPVIEHRGYAGFNNFDWQKGTGISIYANVSVEEDQIVGKTVVGDDLVRNTTYANVDGNYRLGLGGTYSKELKIDTLRSLKVRLGTYGNLSRAINFFNEVQYAAKTHSLSPSLNLLFKWKELFELNPEYSVSFRGSRYEIDRFEDRDIMSHTLRLQTATFFPKKLEWRNDINFNYSPDVAPGFQQSAWFWNSTLAYSVLDDAGTVTLKVYDLLNQNTNASRTVRENFIQDSQSTVLQQYFMLSFAWKFNSLGPKGESGGDNFFMF
ncbi:MAG: TonB-dependent receptor [Flavobacteriaceae bacterium]|nr:TonB-dependent receptor [Flavobacteriaceae bacterium]